MRTKKKKNPLFDLVILNNVQLIQTLCSATLAENTLQNATHFSQGPLLFSYGATE